VARRARACTQFLLAPTSCGATAQSQRSRQQMPNEGIAPSTRACTAILVHAHLIEFCMYVCMYNCMHIVYIYIYSTYVYIYIHTHIHTYIHIYRYASSTNNSSLIFQPPPQSPYTLSSTNYYYLTTPPSSPPQSPALRYSCIRLVQITTTN
jgi:hypothetical protein